MEKQGLQTVQEVQKYLQTALDTFKNDPPDSAFQRGYQAALQEALKVVTGHMPSLL